MPGPVSGVVGAAGGAAGGVAGAARGAADGIAHAVGGAAGSIASGGVSAVFDAAGSWVAGGASWLLDQAGALMSASTSAGLGTRWFTAHESVMAVLAASVLLPLACIGAIQAIYQQSPAVLMRSFLVHLPLALLLTGVAVELVRLALAVTDVLSARMLHAGGADTRHLLEPVSNFLATTGIGVPHAADFAVFAAGVIVAVLAFTLWLELVVRAAAVSAAALFLPLALATLVWPAISHWCRRLAETLAALVLSKFVIATVLSLAAGALAGGLGTEGANGGGFAAVLTGIALLLVATLAPFTLLRLVPAVEAGAVAHLESARHRLTGAARSTGRAGLFALDLAGGAGAAEATAGAAASAGGAGPLAGVITGGDEDGSSDVAGGALGGTRDHRGAVSSGAPDEQGAGHGESRLSHAGVHPVEGDAGLESDTHWFFDNRPNPGPRPGSLEDSDDERAHMSGPTP